MQIEYEATFENIDKDEMRERLKKAGANLVRAEYISKRVTLNLPKGNEIPNAWLRVRDNGKKITQTLKIVSNGKIEDQQEVETEVGNFDDTVELFERIGCIKKSFQETKREKWILEPYVEVEGKNKEEVKNVSEKLDFDWSQALFCAVGHLYERKYGIPEDYINNEVSKIVFDMKNPFLNYAQK